MKQHNNSIVCLAGKNEIAVYGLHLLMNHIDKKNLRIIYNAQDDPEPGFDTWQPSLLKVAKENNITVISLEEFYSLESIIFLSLEFYKIIIPNRFSSSDLFNIHFSKLPSYKGMYTSALPILNNEFESGVTLHKIDSGIDTGDIVDQITFEIDKQDTVRDVYFKYLDNSKILLKKNIVSILKRKTISHRQSSEGSTYFSSKTIDYKNLKVKLFATAYQIKNQIRAFFFPEYQVPKVHGYFIYSAKINSKKSSKKPGEILSVTKNHILISTIDYDLTLFRDKNAELFESAKNNNIKLALECLECGAEVNYRQGKNGLTPLLVSSSSGSFDVLRLLICNGANVNLADYEGKTPLMYAISYYESTGKSDLLTHLKRNGANFDIKDIYNKSVNDYLVERNISNLF